MNFKTIFILVVSLTVLFIIFQNSQAVAMRFLFWEVSMSGILLFPLIFVLGGLIGWILCMLYVSKR